MSGPVLAAEVGLVLSRGSSRETGDCRDPTCATLETTRCTCILLLSVHFDLAFGAYTPRHTLDRTGSWAPQ